MGSLAQNPAKVVTSYSSEFGECLGHSLGNFLTLAGATMLIDPFLIGHDAPKIVKIIRTILPPNIAPNIIPSQKSILVPWVCPTGL